MIPVIAISDENPPQENAMNILLTSLADHLRVTRFNQARPQRKMLRFSVFSLTIATALASCLCMRVSLGWLQLRPEHSIKDDRSGQGSMELCGDLPIVHLTGDGALMGRQFGLLCGAQANRLLTLMRYRPKFSSLNVWYCTGRKEPASRASCGN